MTIRTNADRADRAMRGLRAYKGTDWCERVEASGDDIQEALGDLLCDLHHLADACELSWDDLLNRGAMHHSAEVLEEAEEAVLYEDADQRLGGNDA